MDNLILGADHLPFDQYSAVHILSRLKTLVNSCHLLLPCPVAPNTLNIVSYATILSLVRRHLRIYPPLYVNKMSVLPSLRSNLALWKFWSIPGYKFGQYSIVLSRV